MASDNTIASIEEQQNILRQKAAAARKAALNAPTEAEREKYMAERDSYNQQIKELTAQKTTVSENNPSTDTYAGPDKNSGKDKYYNTKTGEMYLSDTAPTLDQRRSFNTTVDASGEPINNVVNNNPQQTDPPTQPPVAESNVPVAIQPAETNLQGDILAPTVIYPSDLKPGEINPGSDATFQPVTNVILPLAEQPAQVTEDQQLLTPEQSIAKAQVQPDAQDPQAIAADNVNKTNAGITETIQKNPVSSAGNNEFPNNNVASSVDAARAEGTNQAQYSVRQQEDWRVRLTLAQEAPYLYNASKEGDILYPLSVTKGVVFPYTPQIQMLYKANYEVIDVVHSNYKQYFYKNSSVEDINITCTFTAQDTAEANYLLAVMHFFKSVTKMFYGQDNGQGSPRAGTPPPLCFLFGLGQFQFSEHPVLINSFSYTLPDDVDYIRSGSTTQYAGVNLGAYTPKPKAATGWKSYLPSLDRLAGSKLTKSGINPEPAFQYLSNSQATYVPTKIQLQIGAYPIVTRKSTTDVFSLTDYATGKLLQRGFW